MQRKKQGESQNSADSDIFNKKFPPRHLSSEIPLNFWKLLVIFLERTIIAIPLIVLFANMIGL